MSEIVRTTIDKNHSHTYKRGSKFTSFNSGHRHKVVKGKVLKAKQDGHTHELTLFRKNIAKKKLKFKVY